jgi:hypothetical protein
MGVIVRISKNGKPEDAFKALTDLAKKSGKRKAKQSQIFMVNSRNILGLLF